MVLASPLPTIEPTICFPGFTISNRRETQPSLLSLRRMAIGSKTNITQLTATVKGQLPL
jgi:hypothetical protein